MSTHTPTEWLQQGQQALLQGDKPQAAAALQQALHDPATRLTAHNLIERNGLDGAFTSWMGCNCEIAPADDIFQFFATHPTSTNPLRDYLADGWRTLSELMWLLEKVQRPLLGMHSVLEFASGHGRFTRHLVKALELGRVTVSDVVPDAVQFASNTFGVPGFLSTAQPEDLAPPASYELVFVLSLFSHLPRATWGRWLRALYDCVAPGGLLVFTTHGAEAVRRQGVTLDDQGFFFAPASESRAIAAQEYGTAFTSDAFVRREIATQLGRDLVVHWQPQHFWHHQDAYAVARPAA